MGSKISTGNYIVSSCGHHPELAFLSQNYPGNPKNSDRNGYNNECC
jgi:hypothetical protein